MQASIHIRTLRLAAAACATLSLLAACGDGSQPQDAAQRAPMAIAQRTPVTGSTQTIRVALPPLNIEVVPHDFVAGHAARLELQVSDPAAVRKVTALAGDSYEQASAVAITQQDAGSWSIAWPAAGNLLLRFELANGDVLESAPRNFSF